jgi:hypothetical protein
VKEIERRMSMTPKELEKKPLKCSSSPIAVSAYQLGLCSREQSKTVPSFAAHFLWTKRTITTPSSRSFWSNEERQRIIGKHGNSLLLCYKVDTFNVLQNRHRVQSILLCFENENKFTKVLFNDAKKMQQSKYASDVTCTRFVVEIPQKSIRNRVVTQFKIKFENATVVNEVMMLKYELRLLEMAAIVQISLGEISKENMIHRRESSVAQFLPQQHVNKPPILATPKKSALKSPNSFNITSSITKQIHPTDLSKLLENLKRKKSLEVTPKKNEPISTRNEPKRLNKLFQERMEQESRNFDLNNGLKPAIEISDAGSSYQQYREELKK